VLTQAHMVCAMILVNYRGSQHAFYDRTRQNKADEITPTIFTCRTGFGVECTKEMLPKSHEMLQQICQEQYNVSLADQVKYQTHMVSNGV